MVIELTSRQPDQSYLIHELTINKSRYQEAALGSHQFRIRAFGLTIFPSLHFQVHHHSYMDLELLRTIPVATPGPHGSLKGTSP